MDNPWCRGFNSFAKIVIIVNLLMLGFSMLWRVTYGKVVFFAYAQTSPMLKHIKKLGIFWLSHGITKKNKTIYLSLACLLFQKNIYTRTILSKFGSILLRNVVVMKSEHLCLPSYIALNLHWQYMILLPLGSFMHGKGPSLNKKTETMTWF